MGRQPGGLVARGGWGAALLAAGLLMGLAAQADTVVPLVTPNTTITLTNSTAKTVTGNVEYNQVGTMRGNGQKFAYSLGPFEQKAVPNPATDTNILFSSFATIEPDVDTTTGAKFSDPSVTAFDCDNGNGHAVPVWSLDKVNNTSPLAGNLRTGQEYLILATGDQDWSTTVTGTVRDPANIYPATSSSSTHWQQASVILCPVGGIFNAQLAPDLAFELHFQQDGSQGYSALLYTDPASLDTRIEEMKRYTIPTDPVSVVRAYIEKWLPKNDWRFYLDNITTRALINGDAKGTPSYAVDLATILITSPGSGGKTLDQMTQWLRDQTDCNLANGELCSAYKPLGWFNSSPGIPGISIVGASCNDAGVSGFDLDPTNVQVAYSFLKDRFLLKFVMNNPELFGGQAGGLPDLSHDPGWTIGTDSYSCP